MTAHKDLVDALCKFLDEDDIGFDLPEVHTVWFSKTLQNSKGLFIVIGDPRYFELTYNGDKDEIYIDVYQKISNVKVPNS